MPRLHAALLLVLAVAGLVLPACNGDPSQVATNAVRSVAQGVKGVKAATPKAQATPATTAQPTTATTESAPPTTTATAVPSGGNDVVIQNFLFANVVAKAGQVTIVDNKDPAPHTLTADDKSFDTGIIAANANGKFTAPSAPGTYKIHCDVHPYMTGTLVVS